MKTDNERNRQNAHISAKINNTPIDANAFARLVEQVSQIATSLQELKTQKYPPEYIRGPEASLPMMPYPSQPPLPIMSCPPVSMMPYPSQAPLPTTPYKEESSKSIVSNEVFETALPPLAAASGATSIKDTLIPTVSEETVQDDNIKSLEVLSKFHKQDEIISTIIAMLQYFLVIKCKQKFHANWINKKDYTWAELLLALTTNPKVFGADFESSIQSTWIKHLKDNQEIYSRALTIIHAVIQASDDTFDAKYCLGKLNQYLISSKNIVFTKKSIIKEALEKQITTKNIVKKPNIKYVVKNALDQILIQILDTALSLELVGRKDNFEDYLLKLFTTSNYSYVCKYLIDVASNQLQERAKLAQEKRQKKTVNLLVLTRVETLAAMLFSKILATYY